jgi:tetratricopeptide (TPR) repeat protein
MKINWSLLSAVVLLPLLSSADPKYPTGPAAGLYLPGEEKGDAKRALKEVLDCIKLYPNSPTLGLMLSKVARFEPMVLGGRKTVQNAFGSLYQSTELKSHWNREALRTVLIDYYRANGQQKKALELQKSRGYVRSWIGIGPFGYSFRAGIDASHAVERDMLRESFEVKKRYPSRRSEARWSDLAKDQSPWSLNASLFSISNGGGTYYAATEITAAKDQKGWLVFTGQSAKLWVNRVEVGRIDRQRERFARTLRFPIQLKKGPNRLCVKVPGGAISFKIRLTTESGESMSFTDGKVFRFNNLAIGASSKSLKPFISATHEAMKKESRWSFDMRIAYAYYLMSVESLREEGLAELETVLKEESAKGSVWVHVLAGIAYESASHMARSVRIPKAQSFFERALKLSDGACIPASRRLAQFLRFQNKIVEAIAMLEEIQGKSVKDLETSVSLYRVFQSQNWQGEARELLARLIKEHGPLPMLMKLKAAAHTSLGQHEKTREIYQALYKNDKRMGWFLSQKRRALANRGDFEGALTILEEEKRRAPGNKVSHVNAELQIYRSMGNVEKEVAALRAMVDLFPESDASLEKLAMRLAEMNGKESSREALEALKGLLKKKPGRHDLRALIARLEGKSSRFWEKWDITVKELREMKVKHDSFPQASTILLFDQEVTRIFHDGSIEQVITQAWKVVDDRGVEAMGERPESGELMAIQTILPDGTVLEPIRTSGGGYQMPGLKPGAIVFHKYRSTRGASGFQFSYGPWWFQDPDQAEPYALSRWVLICDEGAKFQVVERNMPVKPRVEKSAGLVTRIWETRMLDRVEPEPNMPSRDEILPHVKLYEPRALAAVIPFYKDSPLGSSHVTPSVLKIARTVTSGLKSDFDRAHALFRYIKDEIKPGGGGSAAQILASRRGSLLPLYRAFLKALGLPFDDAIAGLNPHLEIVTNWEQTSYGQFQTPLLRLKFEKQASIWVGNEGGRYMPFGSFPERLWGAPVLLLGPENHGMETLPAHGAERVGNVAKLKIALGDRGQGTIKRTSKVLNFGSYSVKEVVQNLSQAQLQNFLQRQANSQFPGAQVKAFSFPRSKDPKSPFTTSETIEVPNLVRQRGDGKWIVPTGFARVLLSQAFGGRPSRRFDIVLRNWLNFHDHIEIQLGKFSVSALPKDLFIKKQYASYSLTFRRKGEIIIIERHLIFPPGRIPAKGYGDFLLFLEAIDTAELGNLVVERRP